MTPTRNHPDGGLSVVTGDIVAVVRPDWEPKPGWTRAREGSNVWWRRATECYVTYEPDTVVFTASSS